MVSLWLVFILYVLGGGLAALVSPARRGLVSVTSFGVGLVCFAWAAWGFLSSGQPEEWIIPLAAPLGSVPIVMDGLSVFFGFVVAAAAIPAALCFHGWLARHCSTRLHVVLFHVLFAAMLGVVLVGSVMAFLVVWELMSLASALLLAYEHRRDDVREALIHYLVTMHVGVVLLVCGFLLASTVEEGVQPLAGLATVLGSQTPRAAAAFLLLFAGFGMKAGLVPLHSWRPKAYPVAPAPVAGVMSGLMLKVALYGILRTVSFVSTVPLWLGFTVLGIGLASAFLGIAQSLAERDLRKILAYSSIENAGLLVMGVGLALVGIAVGNPLLAELGTMACLLHCLNHAVIKPLLFYAGGVVETHCGTRDIECMGGLARKLPRVASCFLVGVLSACGLPPFNGFLSKFLLFSAMLAGITAEGKLVSVVLIFTLALTGFVSVMALVSYLRLFGVAFLGTWRGSNGEPPPVFSGEMTLGSAWGIIGLASACLILGVMPVQVVDATRAATEIVLRGSAVGQGSSFLFEPLLQASLVFAFFLMMFFGLNAWRLRLVQRAGVRHFKTWDCGYQGKSARIQYTAHSFAAPLVQLLRHALVLREVVQRPVGHFPQRVAVEAEGEDFWDVRLIRPALQRLRSTLGLLGWIQSGHTQRYILYGLVFMGAVLLWVMGVRS